MTKFAHDADGREVRVGDSVRIRLSYLGQLDIDPVDRHGHVFGITSSGDVAIELSEMSLVVTSNAFLKNA